MAMVVRWCLVVILTLCPVVSFAAGPISGGRIEITHPGKGHEVHLSAPGVAVGRAGQVLVTWIAQQGHTNHVYLARPGSERVHPVRVNPDGLSAESMHQAPAIAAGPGGGVYVSWSSEKAKPEGTFFASDLQLSRSLDGGQRFDPPLRVNDDRPIAHSFDGLTMGSDGKVYLGWIDAREGGTEPRTFLARIGGHGSDVEHVVKLDAAETCVCCRVDVVAHDRLVAVLWRKVFPGQVRDMVLGLSRDSGRSFAPPVLVHADGWKIAACPHRGGRLALDRRGRIHAAWYTEGRNETPRVLFATSTDGRGFDVPRQITGAAGAVPDHVRLAVNGQGTVVVVWEDSTAVRRRIRLRTSLDGGRSFSPPQSLSTAVKAYAPDVVAAPNGDFVAVWHEEQFPVTKTVVQWLGRGR
jgi:hypothetical protein